MAWAYLLIAAAFEVVFATSMKASEGFTRLWPSIVTVVAVCGGIGFLTLALKELPISVGYTIWVGIGTAGTVLIGVVWFGEPMNVAKAVSIGAIMAGVVGLKIASA